MNLQSKYKEPTPSSIDVASSWVLTQVDYTAAIDSKPTKAKLKFTRNAELYISGRKERSKTRKSQMKV